MKITNIDTGKPYQLDPDTELTVERTNPFFYDYGEQTLPVALPDSTYNRMLLGLPDRVQRNDKIKMIDATIQDGTFFSVAKQAILSVNSGESIDTSFYMNDGSFYSKLEETTITDVFGDETIGDFSSVEQAINWMELLWSSGGDDNFACFQVTVEDENEMRTLNLWEKRSEHFGDHFYHAVDRVDSYHAQKDEKSNGGRIEKNQNLFIPKGFYLTPFIKVNYVLKRLFQYFGYTLQSNFLSYNEQFRNLVFVNNVADAIVTGTIKVSQLIPKVSCKKILELIRKKFCCEILTDEVAKTATIVLMNDIITSNNKRDFSKFVAGKMKISFPDGYRRVVLKPAGTVGSKNESSLDSLELIRSQFPTSQYSEERGVFYRDGFQYDRYISNVREIVADTSQSYNEGGDIATVDIEIPESIPVTEKGGSLFIGKVQYLNSSLHFGTVDDNQEVDSNQKSSEDKMDLMMAFVYKNGSYTGGTVTTFGSSGTLRNESYKRIGDYSLLYNGQNGIFECFYRKYDTLLRNSMHTVEAKLLLSQKLKQEIRAIDKVCINAADYLIDTLKFSLGKKNDTSEVKLLTTQLYSPVNTAKTIEEIIPPLSKDYKWIAKSSAEQMTKEEYDKSNYREVGSPLIFPPVPTAADVGKKYHLRKAAYHIDANSAPRPVHGESWWLFTFWLEAVRNI